jgi:large subunit ribosomal protein L23
VTVDLIPVVSEKALAGTADRVYSFKVPKRAEKLAIKRAVESQFKVTVVGIRTARKPDVAKKAAGQRRAPGIRPGFKKAMVTLKKGDKISEMEGN